MFVWVVVLVRVVTKNIDGPDGVVCVHYAVSDMTHLLFIGVCCLVVCVGG